MIQIRAAHKSEIEWINRSYDEIHFMHSSFDKEVIAIAEKNGQKAGLGRLVTIDATHLELGGMYVFEGYRGEGIARKIVSFLLQHTLPSQSVYCIPYEHLVPFYREFGFVPCTSLESVPKEVLTKCAWCKSTYETPTALLILKNKDL